MTPAAAAADSQDRLCVTYIGHATMLLRFEDVCLLTDPNFDDKLGHFLPRVTPPGVKMAELPRIDAILLTHAHADHLSFRTLRQLPRDILIIAPPTIASWLQREGLSSVRAVAAGERVQVGSVAITAARAKHTGARYGIDRWRGEAYMYLIDDGISSVLFTGDTSLTPAAAKLAQQILPRRVDVALLPIGYAPWWKRYLFRRGHLTPADALELFTRVNARTLVPFHWGTFRHVTSGAYDAINVFRSLLPAFARKLDVTILNPGESVRIAVSDG